MRPHITFGLLFFSSLAISAESIEWVGKNDVISEAHQKSLSVAKDWASKFYENEESIVEFHYRVSGGKSKTIITVLPVYDGGYIITDGEMCLSIVNFQELIDAKQCIAP